jgi:ATP-dependent DNA helicase MPH1
MDIQPYVREERVKGKRSPAKETDTTSKKRRRNEDVMRNIPAGTHMGFMSVADLIIKGSKKRKVVDAKTLEEEGEDDDVDKMLDTGITELGSRRTQSFASTAAKAYPWDEENLEKPKSKGKMKRAATESTAKAKPRPRRKKKDAEDSDEELDAGKKTKGKGKANVKAKEQSVTLSQQGRDDSVDRELEKGSFDIWEKNQKERSLSLSPPGSPLQRSTPKRVKKQPSPLKEDSAMEVSDRATERYRSRTPSNFS